MVFLFQFLIGLVFGFGLIVAGMSDPQKVLNFLDLAAIPSGGWDASLAFVMMGAILVTFFGFRMVLARKAPLFGDGFHLPTQQGIDARILLGSAIFGIGWGLAGICPGPAFTMLAAGSAQGALFVSAMLIGMVSTRMSRIA
jgi:uncharacterized protein